ncbi:hypothetical protein BC938DRAFT_476772 [Jimgerdemannia flammicorona]|uniref:Uncharacterized protein n=1 Tax=Jimgerdemannia flammicorona TaxID=994334 RepID=A0A433QQ52_9FUNG|nr:hypothetical protein BC938DRAFT_476772 [Jimgerdemannia flammicorona]
MASSAFRGNAIMGYIYAYVQSLGYSRLHQPPGFRGCRFSLFSNPPPSRLSRPHSAVALTLPAVPTTPTLSKNTTSAPASPSSWPVSPTFPFATSASLTSMPGSSPRAPISIRRPRFARRGVCRRYERPFSMVRTDAIDRSYRTLCAYISRENVISTLSDTIVEHGWQYVEPKGNIRDIMQLTGPRGKDESEAYLPLPENAPFPPVADRVSDLTNLISTNASWASNKDFDKPVRLAQSDIVNANEYTTYDSVNATSTRSL